MIVSRGLGRGIGALLVTAGLGLGGDASTPPLPPQRAVSAGGGGGQMSMSEWRRRFGPAEAGNAEPAELAPAPGGEAERARRKRRRLEEETLLLLG